MSTAQKPTVTLNKFVQFMREKHTIVPGLFHLAHNFIGVQQEQDLSEFEKLSDQFVDQAEVTSFDMAAYRFKNIVDCYFASNEQIKNYTALVLNILLSLIQGGPEGAPVAALEYECEALAFKNGKYDESRMLEESTMRQLISRMRKDGYMLSGQGEDGDVQISMEKGLVTSVKNFLYLMDRNSHEETMFIDLLRHKDSVLSITVRILKQIHTAFEKGAGFGISPPELVIEFESGIHLWKRPVAFDWRIFVKDIDYGPMESLHQASQTILELAGKSGLSVDFIYQSYPPSVATVAQLLMVDRGVMAMAMAHLSHEFRKHNCALPGSALLGGVLDGYKRELFLQVSNNSDKLLGISDDELHFIMQTIFEPTMIAAENQEATRAIMVKSREAKGERPPNYLPLIIGGGAVAAGYFLWSR